MSTADLSHLHQALDLLEEREAELLVWGDTDGAFTHADIISLFTRHLPYEDAESLLAELQNAAMLFSVPTSKGGDALPHAYGGIGLPVPPPASMVPRSTASASPDACRRLPFRPSPAQLSEAGTSGANGAEQMGRRPVDERD